MRYLYWLGDFRHTLPDRAAAAQMAGDVRLRCCPLPIRPGMRYLRWAEERLRRRLTGGRV